MVPKPRGGIDRGRQAKLREREMGMKFAWLGPEQSGSTMYICEARGTESAWLDRQLSLVEKKIGSLIPAPALLVPDKPNFLVAEKARLTISAESSGTSGT